MSLRQRIRAGECVIGAWIMTPNAAYVELAADFGVDFLILDLEHGALSLSDVENLTRVMRRTATAPLVRVPSHDPTFVARVLDRGAEGIIVPRVEDAETAASLAAAARFPPEGQRGLALGAIRASGYGMNKDYRTNEAADTLVVMQIESRRALQDCVAIASVPGVDMAFIGPADLAADMGLEGPENADALCAAVDDGARRLHKAGIPAATVPHGGRRWQTLASGDFAMIAAYSDIGALRDGVLAMGRDVQDWRESLGGRISAVP